MKKKLKVRKVEVPALTEVEKRGMWELYRSFYDHVNEQIFYRDLAEKQFVFLGFDSRDSVTVRGFSTAMIYEHSYGGERVGVLYSGDTIIHPDYWGQLGLHIAFFKACLSWKLRHPFHRFYWLLISSGIRTYLGLARNFPEHWPHYRKPLPSWEKGLIHSIAAERFGAKWNPDKGLVIMEKDGLQPKLKEGVAPLTSEVAALEEIQFFLKVNPRYADGDELAILGRMNFTWAIFNVVKRLRRRREIIRKAVLGYAGIRSRRGKLASARAAENIQLHG